MKLKRTTAFPVHHYSETIAQLFDFEEGFNIHLSLNDSPPITINRLTKYNNIQSEFSWDIREIISENPISYEYSTQITGKILTTEKPLKPNARGISLFANGRLVNAPEFYGPSESSHFYSYATGWLNVDFIDLWTEDVIATNRQSIDWENPKTESLKAYLVSCISIVERKWRRKRKEKKQLTTKAEGIDVEDWIDKLPSNLQSSVGRIIAMLQDTPEISNEAQRISLSLLHEIVPEYTDLHFRYLEPEIQEVAGALYKEGKYYAAFVEALKRYVQEVRDKSGLVGEPESSLMDRAFANLLKVTHGFTLPNGNQFTPDTISNIEKGQHFLSRGIIMGGRHILAHEIHEQLKQSGLFTEKDCLDLLSLLSHLFKRLKNAPRISTT